MIRITFIFAALSGFFAVALGAFAAHGLKGQLEPNLLGSFQTGVSYQMYHSLALLGIALWLQRETSLWLKISCGCFMMGIVFFSGSLYGLALSGPLWLGPITPIGGLLFLLGWLALAAAACSRKLR